MKKRNKLQLICSIVLTFTLIFSMTGTIFAQESNGLPPLKVMFNGQYLDLKTDPFISNGQLMVSLDECKNSLSQINGKPVLISAPATPTGLLQSSPTVSLRAVCEELGYSLSWDEMAETAVIIDFKGMFASMDEEYTILNRLMQLTYDPDQTYVTTSETTGSMKIDIGDGNTVTAGIQSTGEMINQKMNMSASLKMNLNYDLSSTLTQDMTPVDIALMESMLDPLKDLEIQMILNADEETLYLNLGSLGTLASETFGLQEIVDGYPQAIMEGNSQAIIDDNTWLKADFSNLVDRSGYDGFIRMLLSGDTSQITVGSLLQLVLDRPDIYTVDDYESMCIAFDTAKELLSDKAFTVSGTAQQPTYELVINADKLTGAMLAIAKKHPEAIGAALSGGMDLSALETFAKTFANYNMTLKFTIKGPHAYDTSINYSYDTTLVNILDASGSLMTSPSDEMQYKVQMTADSQFPGQSTTDMSYLYKFKTDDVYMSVDMTMKDISHTSITTTKTVQTAPPANATILDIGKLLAL